MRKLFVSAAVTAAISSLAISVTPALGLTHEFYGDTNTPTESFSSTAPVFQLGSSGWVECSKIKTAYDPSTTTEVKFKLKMEEFTTCSYNHNQTGDPVTVSPKCPIVLQNTNLAEEFTNEFDEGRGKLDCNLHFVDASKKCEIIIKEPATVVPEFAWRNTDTTYGHYESLLLLRLEKLTYTISSACGSNGTNGEIDYSVPIVGEIVK